MPRTKKTEEQETPSNIETALQEAAVSMAEVTFVHLEYVGPDYTHGIQLPGRKDLVRPREFTPEQIGDFTEQFPKYTSWWIPAGQ